MNEIKDCIKYIPLHTDEMRRLQVIMALGSRAAYRNWIKSNKNYNRVDFRIRIVKGDSTVDGVTIPDKDLKLIHRVETIKDRVLNSVGGLLLQKAHQWNFINDVDDIYNECVTIACKAIWGYSKPKVKYSTYCHQILDAEIGFWVWKKNKMSGFTSADRSLCCKWQAYQQQNPEKTYAEIANELLLDSKQLHTALAGNATMDFLPEDVLFTRYNDFQEFEDREEREVKFASLRKKLTSVENKVFELFRKGQNTTEIAKDWGVSRQYIDQVYHHIRRKA